MIQDPSKFSAEWGAAAFPESQYWRTPRNLPKRRMRKYFTFKFYVMRALFISLATIPVLVFAAEVGFENSELLVFPPGPDTITGKAMDENNDASASGIVNSGSIDTNNAKDTIQGKAFARGKQSAESFGLLNEDNNASGAGTILTGNGKDQVNGLATAETVKGEALAFGISNINRQAPSQDVATIYTGNSKDIIAGKAEAEGTGDVGAFGVLGGDIFTGNAGDRIIGSAAARGETTTEARGISVGVSDVDDDTISGGGEDPPLIPAEVGQMLTGNGADVLEGTASVTVNAQDKTEIFFAGSNGIVVDGPTEAQFIQLCNKVLGRNCQDGDAEVIQDEILPLLDTSMLDTGVGNDALIADVTLEVSQEFGTNLDDDLEVIGDGIENAGDLLLGDGDDAVNSTVSVKTTISGAKGLADALDNSSVGIITGLGLEVSNETLFDMGPGNDSFTSKIFATATDDLAAADGLGNRGVFVAGPGDDTFNLTSEAIFRRPVDLPNIAEQQEGIADGWENRNIVFLDDQAGLFAGNDSVTISATASGNGVLTIAEGIESREFFDAGGGDDTFDLRAQAISDVVGRVGIDPENITQAAGFQTEQIDEGDLFLGDGDDMILVGSRNRDGTVNSPGAAAVSIGENLGTFAFGVTQVTADASNGVAPDDPGFDPDKDNGLIDTGAGADTLDGIAEAEGESDVDAFGLLFTNAVTGSGADTLKGDATATGAEIAEANGIRVGMSGNDRLPEETGTLLTGSGNDTLSGIASATTSSDGSTFIFNDANAVLVDLNSTLDTGQGQENDAITGIADATDTGVGGSAGSAVVADGIENRGEIFTRGGADILAGTGETQSIEAFAVAGGIDNGLGSTQNGIPVAPLLATGGGNDKLTGSAVSLAVGDNAFAGGIENTGTIRTGAGDDILVAKAVSTVRPGVGAGLSIADGIDNRDLLTTGRDNDRIEATASASADGSDAEAIGIRNNLGTGANTINLGDGFDEVVASARAVSIGGTAKAIGINGGTINAGAGADRIIASSNENLVGNNKLRLAGGRGFGDDVNINMGADNDFLFGFGQAVANGGGGVDELAFAFTLDDFLTGGGIITKGNAGINEVSFAFGGKTLESTSFEVFTFADVSLSYSDI